MPSLDTVIRWISDLGGLAGLAALVSVAVQLKKVKGTVRETNRAATHAATELSPNHGSSIRDAVTRTEQDLLGMRQDLRQLTSLTVKLFGSSGHQVGEVNERLEQAQAQHALDIARIERHLDGKT